MKLNFSKTNKKDLISNALRDKMITYENSVMESTDIVKEGKIRSNGNNESRIRRAGELFEKANNNELGELSSYK